MPRIADDLLDCSVYLYPSIQSATDGERFGGSGFLVHLPAQQEGRGFPYALTNKHVLDGGCHTLRINTEDGKSEIIATNPDDWVHHPAGDDLAAIPIDVSRKDLKWLSVSTDQFVTKEIVSEYKLGPGDDVFLVGRLVTLEGRQRNTPIARFGNVSMMAYEDEPIQIGDRQQEAFLIECRSLSGFSGSPVFVTTSRAYYDSDVPKDLVPKQYPNGGVTINELSVSGTWGPWLLGIDCAHMPLWRPVYLNDKRTQTDCFTDMNTGIACVIPAWRILTLLKDQELVKQRK